MISEADARRLLEDMDRLADKELYIFMDDQEKVIDSEWLKDDGQALEYARAMGADIYTLRYVPDLEAA